MLDIIDGHSFDAQIFLDQYWQKKPLLIRQFFPDFETIISPDELAGLALEENVESRIIIENGKTPWELLNGPFKETIFDSLPDEKWTLLIQSVDHITPEFQPILSKFSFIPQWRLDDIMISFAPKGGSVGPHFDQYDVFLLQAQGTRHWKLSDKVAQDAPMVEGTPLHIIKTFETVTATDCLPGDVLYIPPAYGHHGVALDDCLTYSIGFRAPSIEEILHGVVHKSLDEINEQARYTDPALATTQDSACITADAITQLTQLIQQQLSAHTIQDWFGEYMTEPKSIDFLMPPESPLNEADFIELLTQDSLHVNEGSRIAYLAITPTDDTLTVYVDGQKYQAPLDALTMIKALSTEKCLILDENDILLQNHVCISLILNWYNKGSLYFGQEV